MDLIGPYKWLLQSLKFCKEVVQVVDVVVSEERQRGPSEVSMKSYQMNDMTNEAYQTIQMLQISMAMHFIHDSILGPRIQRNYEVKLQSPKFIR